MNLMYLMKSLIDLSQHYLLYLKFLMIRLYLSYDLTRWLLQHPQYLKNRLFLKNQMNHCLNLNHEYPRFLKNHLNRLFHLRHLIDFHRRHLLFPLFQLNHLNRLYH